MSSKLYLERLLVGLVIGLVIELVVGLTEADNELTKGKKCWLVIQNQFTIKSVVHALLPSAMGSLYTTGMILEGAFRIGCRSLLLRYFHGMYWLPCNLQHELLLSMHPSHKPLKIFLFDRPLVVRSAERLWSYFWRGAIYMNEPLQLPLSFLLNWFGRVTPRLRMFFLFLFLIWICYHIWMI